MDPGRTHSQFYLSLLLIGAVIGLSACQVHIKKPIHPSVLANIPAVNSIVPPNGPLAGGTQITITGTNFDPAATVTVGGATCGSIQVISTTQIKCVVPAHPAGSTAVDVINPGSNFAAGTYLYYVAAQANPSFAITLGGGPTSAAGMRVQSSIGEPASAQVQSAAGISSWSGISNVVFPHQ